MSDKRRWLPSWQRVELVEKCLQEGMSRRQAAAWRRVSPSTVQYWVARYRAASAVERQTGSWARDHSCAPRWQPRLTTKAVHDRVCHERIRTGWGPRLIASELGLPHATVSRCLERRGLSRRPKPVKEEIRRFEWPCPGDLLQMDTKRFARFSIARSRRHRRSPSHRPREARTRGLGVRALDHRRPHAPGIHRAAPRRTRRHSDRLRRASAQLLQRPRDHPQAPTDRQRVHLHQEPTPGRALRDSQHHAPHDPATHPQAQRQD